MLIGMIVAGSRFDDVTQWFSNSKNNRRTPNNDISTRAPMATGIYIIPTITDNQILPNSYLNATNNNITLKGSPSEYLSASFVVHTIDDITGMTTSIGDLTGPTTIDKSAINLRVVKVWYQAGVDISDTTHKQLTPELLLKDDSLVQILGTDKLYKFTDGTLHLISGTAQPQDKTPTITDFPIQDAGILQPISIPAGTNKQFWVTIKIPNTAVPGIL